MEKNSIGFYKVKVTNRGSNTDQMLLLTNFRMSLYTTKKDMEQGKFNQSHHYYDLEKINSLDSLHFELVYTKETIRVFSEHTNKILFLIAQQIKDITRCFPENKKVKFIFHPEKRSEFFGKQLKEMNDQIEKQWKTKPSDPKYLGNNFITCYKASCNYLGIPESSSFLLNLQKFFRMELLNPFMFSEKTYLGTQDHETIDHFNIDPLFYTLIHSTYFHSIDLTNINSSNLLSLLSKVIKENTTISSLTMSNLEHFENFPKLIQGLESNPKIPLTKLDVSNNPLGDKMSYKLILNICNLDSGIEEINITIEKWLVTSSLDNKNPLKDINLGGGSLVINSIIKIFEEKFSEKLQKLDISGSKINTKNGSMLSSFIKKSSELKYLNLSNCKINKSTLQSLLKAIETNKSIKDFILILNNNNLGSNGANLIGNHLKNDNKIQSIILDENNFKSKGVLLIFESLMKNTTVRHLSLSRNIKKGDNNDDLINLLDKFLIENKTIKVLNLEGATKNYKFGSALKSILTSLGENPHLKRLNVGYNDLGDEGLFLLGSSLQNNTNLTALRIDEVGGEVTVNGLKYFVKNIIKNNQIVDFTFPTNIIKKIGKKKIIEELETSIQFMLERNNNRNLVKKLAPLKERQNSENHLQRNSSSSSLSYSSKENENNQNDIIIEKIKDDDDDDVDDDNGNDDDKNEQGGEEKGRKNENKIKNSRVYTKKLTLISESKTTLESSYDLFDDDLKKKLGFRKNTKHMIDETLNNHNTTNIDKKTNSEKGGDDVNNNPEQNIKKEIRFNKIIRINSFLDQKTFCYDNTTPQEIQKKRKQYMRSLKKHEMDQNLIAAFKESKMHLIEKILDLNSEKAQSRTNIFQMANPKDGNTVLHYACYLGNSELLSKILRLEGSVLMLNYPNKMGLTPLHLLMKKNPNTECLVLLSDYYVDYNATDKRGWNALQLLLYSYELFPNIDCVVKMLLDRGIDPNHSDETGSSALHRAAGSGINGPLKYLIEYGGDVNNRDNSDSTPLHKAARNGRIQSVNILLKHNAQINILDSAGNTPVSLSRIFGQKKVEMLLDPKSRSEHDIVLEYDDEYYQSNKRIGEKDDSYYQYTILLIGSMKCGKSKLVERFRTKLFSDRYYPTITKYYKFKSIVEGKRVLIKILDVSGDPIYQNFRSDWIRKADGFIFCYSINDKKECLEELVTYHKKICILQDQPKKIPMILTSLKNDLNTEAVIPNEAGKNLAKQFKCPFLSVSAKGNYNVDLAFKMVLMEIKRISTTRKPIKGQEFLTVAPKKRGLFSKFKSNHSSQQLNNQNKKSNKISKNLISFEEIINSKKILDYFYIFLQKEYAEENLMFYSVVKSFKQIDSQSKEFIQITAKKIFDNYISVNAELQINIDYNVRNGITQKIDKIDSIDQELFDSAMIQILEMLKTDCYPKFVKSSFYEQLINKIYEK
ncbi:ankyrin repeat family protein [Anaeramoeba flamelloides]|uniref:Ankyrin repeat family protein n=1 Tax=Anaeramoeba flamelloides TaxID=1746091 RepID=A0ABQ8X6B3_9EUKA|nr:ankyrin repeat family protein [Anaeramoeba flamelloides]